MLCHRRRIADVEPVRGSLLRALHQTLMPLHLAPGRERSMLRPQPTVVGWGLNIRVSESWCHSCIVSINNEI